MLGLATMDGVRPSVAALGILVVLTLLYGTCLAIYRLYLHPLSKIPGPKHLAVSGLFHSYKNFLRGTWYKYMLEVHEKHGPIARVGPNHLAVDGSIGWNDVYGHKRANRPEFGRIQDFFDPGREGMQSIFTADRENHRRQRRLMSHAFSETAMYEQEPLIKGYVDLLISRLKERAGAQLPIDAAQWYNFTTFDIIGDLAFGESFSCLSNSDMHPWVAMIMSSIRGAAMLRFLLEYPICSFLLRLTFGKKLLKIKEEHTALAVEKTKRRIALGPGGNNRKDFLTYMLQHNDEKGMSMNEILTNSENLIVAGSETTASALSGLTFYLTQNMQAMARLREEIRSSFTLEDQITMKSTAPLPYLHACIEEALRIYPPAAETPPRVSPGDYVHGQYVPEGTKITIYQWATHHSSRNFVQPFAFKPERWLPSNHPYYDPAFAYDNKSAFSPFAAGPRNCIGKNLAYSELRLIMSRIFWNFDLELMEGCNQWPNEQKVYIVWDKPPLMVHLKPAARD